MYSCRHITQKKILYNKVTHLMPDCLWNFVRGFRRAYGGLINEGLINGGLINGGLKNGGFINRGRYKWKAYKWRAIQT